MWNVLKIVFLLSSLFLSAPLALIVLYWQLTLYQWHSMDGCRHCHCQKHDNAPSNAEQGEMKVKQQKGQANYSDTHLRADRGENTST